MMMGTKRLLATAVVAELLLGGARYGLGQTVASSPRLGEDPDPLSWTFPIDVPGGRFALEVRLVEPAEGTELLWPDRETVFWQSIVDSENPAVFEVYLEQWPEGTFARLAGIRLEELRTSSSAFDTRPAWTAADSQTATGLLTVLGHKASTRRSDENGWTLLHYAAVLDLPDLVGELLEQDGVDGWSRPQFGLWTGGTTLDVDARLREDGRPLDASLRRALRRLGLDFGDWTRDGETPLHLAASVNARGAVAELLSGGADVHAKTVFDWTPLHYAVWADARDAAEVLLAHNANVEAMAAGGWTPLHLAAWANSLDAAAALLAHGARVAAETDGDDTPLRLANSNRMRALLLQRP